ncbi:NADH-quinone oxidoreductase subunit F [Deltaproteobacteria bacterium Smac51]|nr:NADH-quinone oxidoreductase subunit F [Deltaproteobacteria bacterium Smac51]
MRFTNTRELEKYRHELVNRPDVYRRLWVCGGPGCLAAGGLNVLKALREEAKWYGLSGNISFKVDLSGCQGLCDRGPLVAAEPWGYLYQKVRPEDAHDIIEETMINGRVVERLSPGQNHRKGYDLNFFRRQTRHLMGRMAHMNPESLDDYIKHYGYHALGYALARLTPADVSGRVEASSLRGRGGGGFPAGRKWKACRQAPGEIKYVLANGDEGDPGAFMNRSLMEGDPHSIIEGMILGAYAIGASQGFIYVRHEYPLSVARLNNALDLARERGLLGRDILGSGFDFDIEVVEGGGAFVCGESTALMNSIEGRAGAPRVKYVRSTERGLWDSPTLLQNVETWANVPHIILQGPGWFKGIGSENNYGTKIFSLVGDVRNSGLVEMPLGSTIRSFVMDVGGGPQPGRKVKAVQSGGPSGGCLPRSCLDLPVDFDHLAEAGAMMGSGGLIVMDDLTCMVDVARYFTKFLVGESCGKCAPCREALPRMLKVLEDLCGGRAEKGDTDRLIRWSEMLSKTALCGLGQSAANPVLSTIKYFEDEYREHEEQHFCRAGRCAGLYEPFIDTERCVGCGACIRVCPCGAVKRSGLKPQGINQNTCIACGACLKACHFRAAVARPRG